MKGRFVFSVALLLLLVALCSSAVAADAPVRVGDVLARVNQERVSRGLVPLALSAQLTASAQWQASDMSRTGKYGHTGSDGSTTTVRVSRAGYGKYSWGYRVGENYAVYHDLPTAMTFWMGSRPHRENILHTVYREMGIGLAPGITGTTIIVLDFGAQPNVLPIFIENGVGQTRDAQVTLTLSDEDVSDSDKSFYHATDVQISNDSDFQGEKWQPYAAHIPWTLSGGNGNKTVYVKYRDARGHTVVSSDTVTVGASAAIDIPPAAPATATTRPTLRPSPTVTRTPRPTATPTRKPTATPAPTSTPEPTSMPEATVEPTATPVETAESNGLDVPPPGDDSGAAPAGAHLEGSTYTAAPTQPDAPAQRNPVSTVAPTIKVQTVAQAGPTESVRAVAQVYYDIPTPIASLVRTAQPVAQNDWGDQLAAGMVGAGLLLGLVATIKYKIGKKLK